MNDEHFKAAAHGVLTVCAVLESFSAKTSTRRALLLGMAVFHTHLFVADLRDAQALQRSEDCRCRICGVVLDGRCNARGARCVFCSAVCPSAAKAVAKGAGA